VKRAPTIGLAGLVLLLLGVAGSGCLARQYPEKLRFDLTVDRPTGSSITGTRTMRIRRVRIAPMFDGKSFVYRMTDHRYVEDFYNEFFVPPETVIASSVQEWVLASGLFGAVLSAADSGVPGWYLDVDVTDLYGDLRDSTRPQAVVGVSFALFGRGDSDDSALLRKSYAAHEPMTATTPEALVIGWNAALSRILGDLERDLGAALARAPAR
jgi:uncharacterized lipoprotein YmbA